MKKQQTVELVQAWSWRCPSCGMENFAHMETLDLTLEEKRQAIASAEGLEPDDLPVSDDVLEKTNITSSPERVLCSNCEVEFLAKTREEIDRVTEQSWDDQSGR